MNKKAILKSEILRIVLAVIGIVLLVILATQLYNMFLSKTQLEQARETLEQINEKIEVLEKEWEGAEESLLVTSPKNWVLMSLGKKLCMCAWKDIRSPYIYRENKAFECSEKGVCKDININLEISFACFSLADNCFSFDELPVQIFLFKRSESIELKTREEIKGEGVLEEILIIKDGEKNLGDLILELGGENDKDVRNQIDGILKGYFNELDTGGLFDIEKKNFGWVFDIYKDEKLVLKKSQFDLTDSETIAIYDLDFGEYKIKLSYYKGEYKPPELDIMVGS